MFGALSSGLLIQMLMVRESWPYLRNMPVASSGLYRKTDLILLLGFVLGYHIAAFLALEKGLEE
jgi:hypothetical protein